MTAAMARIQRKGLLVGLLTLGAFSAHALQPLITDDTGTQGSGGNQLEFSWSEDRAKADGETERTRTLPAAYTRGVSETIDVSFGLAHVRVRGEGYSASGAGNPVLGAKWRFYESEASGTSFAVKPEVLLPVSDSREREGLGAGKTSGNLTFIASQEVPFGAVHFNAGVGRERFKDTANNPDASIWRVSLAPVWDVSEQWKLALDAGVESVKAGGERVRTHFYEIGAIYAPNKDVDLALGVIRARDDESPKTRTDTVTAGVTWRF